jgi:hypothetical protein
MTLLQEAKNLAPSEFTEIEKQLHREMKSNQGELVDGVQMLAKEETGFPPGMKKDVLNLTEQLPPFPSPEVQALAMSGLKESLDGLTNRSGDQSMVLDSIVSAVMASGSDSATGWNKISSAMNLNDPAQARLFRAAQTLVEHRKGE